MNTIILSVGGATRRSSITPRNLGLLK